MSCSVVATIVHIGLHSCQRTKFQLPSSISFGDKVGSQNKNVGLLISQMPLAENEKLYIELIASICKYLQLYQN